MADSIKISTQTLIDTAKEIRDCNKAMESHLKDIKQNMNDLESTWKSVASDEIRSKMNALQPRFDEYNAVVESYATFLVNTAQSYESTENAIHSNASAFK